MNIPELEKKIAILDDEVDAILSAFEKEWWSSGNFDCQDGTVSEGIDNFKKYNEGRRAAGGEKMIELRTLELQLRMNKEPQLSKLSPYGSKMSLASFIAECECGGFIDSDGFGRYVKDGQETDIEIYPSDVKNGNLRKDMDYIIWFNK